MFRAALLLLCACHGVYSDPNPSPPDPGPLLAADNTARGMEDQAIPLHTVLVGDRIPEPSSTTIEIIDPPAHGVASAGPTADYPGTYQPFPGFHGTDSFRYQLADARGRTATAIATIQIDQDEVPYEQGMVVDETPITGLVSGDLDSDGKPDLVTTDGTGVLVYLNHSTFERTELEAGHAPRQVILADIDGDSRLDIVVAGADGLVVLRNRTSGAALLFDAPVVLAAGYAVAVATGDIDQDGKQDLLSLDADGPTLDVLLNRSVPDQLAFDARVSFAVGANPIKLQAIDVDHTGGIDVVVLSAGAQQLSIFTNTTLVGAAPTFAARVDRATGSAPKQLVVADVGNGDPWLVVIDADSGLWMYPSSSGTFVNAYVHALPYAQATTVAAASLGFSAGTGFVVGYQGYSSPGMLQQVLVTDANQITTYDMTIGRVDSADEILPDAASGIVQVDLDGIPPAELAVASQLSATGDGQTGLMILYGQ